MSILPRGTRKLILALLALAFSAYWPAKSTMQGAKRGEQMIPQDTLISLERTGCYGTCPIYKVSISADGSVLFKGLRFVKKVGTARSAISQDQIRQLLEGFERINYFDLRDEYAKPEDGCKQWWTDNPSAITSISRNGKSKTVTHYYGCRGLDVLADLERLEQSIDDAVNSAQWIR